MNIKHIGQDIVDLCDANGNLREKCWDLEDLLIMSIVKGAIDDKSISLSDIRMLINKNRITYAIGGGITAHEPHGDTILYEALTLERMKELIAEEEGEAL